MLSVVSPPSSGASRIDATISTTPDGAAGNNSSAALVFPADCLWDQFGATDVVEVFVQHHRGTPRVRGNEGKQLRLVGDELERNGVKSVAQSETFDDRLSIVRNACLERDAYALVVAGWFVTGLSRIFEERADDAGRDCWALNRSENVRRTGYALRYAGHGLIDAPAYLNPSFMMAEALAQAHPAD
jgi:hypothetical protein